MSDTCLQTQRHGVCHTLIIGDGFMPVFTHIATSPEQVHVRSYRSTVAAGDTPRTHIEAWLEELMRNLENPEPFGPTRPCAGTYTVTLST